MQNKIRLEIGSLITLGQAKDTDKLWPTVDAILKKVVEWGDEDCPHPANTLIISCPKRACGKCWQALLKEVE